LELEHPDTGQLTSPTTRFTLATKTYDMTLHNRLLETNVETGASCNDCHAPTKLHHAILSAKNPKSSTHPTQLRATCTQSNCHVYVNNPLNKGFINMDLHDINQIPVNKLTLDNLDSNWYRALVVMLPVAAILFIGSIIWSLFISSKTSKIDALFGGEKFMTKMIGVKRKNAKK